MRCSRAVGGAARRTGGGSVWGLGYPPTVVRRLGSSLSTGCGPKGARCSRLSIYQARPHRHLGTAYVTIQLGHHVCHTHNYRVISIKRAAMVFAFGCTGRSMVRSTDRRGQGKEEKSAAADVKKLLAAFSAIQTSQESFQKEQRKKLDEMAQTQAKLLKLLEQQAKQGA